MFNIGSQELLIILLIVFLLFGPKHIPDVARALGKGLGDIQRSLRGVEESVRRAAEDRPFAGRNSPALPPPIPGRGSIPAASGPPETADADRSGDRGDSGRGAHATAESTGSGSGGLEPEETSIPPPEGSRRPTEEA